MPITIIGVSSNSNSKVNKISDYIENIYGFSSYDIKAPLKTFSELLTCKKQMFFKDLKFYKDYNTNIKNECIEKFGNDLTVKYLAKIQSDMKYPADIKTWIELFKIFITNLSVKYPNGCLVIPNVQCIEEINVIHEFGGYIIYINSNKDLTNELVSDLKNLSNFTIDNCKTNEIYDIVSRIIDDIIHQ